ncbi:MAG TPA: protein UsfY [Mycobacterium sp.]|nr:protein UsfY [Mycobacterium sp.]
MSSILLSRPMAEGEVMGDRHHDPTDHFRTTQPHAGITMKDNLFWPGFILLIVAFFGMISTAAAAAYGHYEWLATTVLVAVLGTVAGALWFVVELRRVASIDEQWHVADAESQPRQRAAAKSRPVI